MKQQQDYLEMNRESWNKRTVVHWHSDFYDREGFLNGKNALNDIELTLLGDLSGKTVLHLQCHFGLDSLSLSRMGADVTGVDLSDKAIESARQLANDTRMNARFICCNLYDLPQQLDETFDVVFTSYGTITWLPDLDQWARIVSQFLRPGGKFVMAEFHPFVWMFDDHFEKVAYRYFNSGPIVETETGTYADRLAPITTSYVVWNHGIGEVLNSLISQGLEIKLFEEFDYSPYDCFNKSIEYAPKRFRIEHLDDKIPMVYALAACKKEQG